MTTHVSKMAKWSLAFAICAGLQLNATPTNTSRKTKAFYFSSGLVIGAALTTVAFAFILKNASRAGKIYIQNLETLLEKA